MKEDPEDLRKRKGRFLREAGSGGNEKQFHAAGA
jgi:hypothetical protein